MRGGCDTIRRADFGDGIIRQVFAHGFVGPFRLLALAVGEFVCDQLGPSSIMGSVLVLEHFSVM